MRLVSAAWLLLVASPVLAQTQAPAEDEKLLRSAHVGTSGQEVIGFLHRRFQSKVERDTLTQLVKKLGAGAAEAETAMSLLIGFGAASLPALREAHKDPALEGAKLRIAECLRWIEGPAVGDLTRAVLR